MLVGAMAEQYELSLQRYCGCCAPCCRVLTHGHVHVRLPVVLHVVAHVAPVVRHLVRHHLRYRSGAVHGRMDSSVALARWHGSAWHGVHGSSTPSTASTNPQSAVRGVHMHGSSMMWRHLHMAVATPA